LLILKDLTIQNFSLILESKNSKNKLLLNLFSSLLFLFVLFNSISKTYAVECNTSKNTSSCDVTKAKTQPIGKFTGSKSLTVNFQADVIARINHLINVDATNASNIFTNFQTISPLIFKQMLLPESIISLM